MSANVKTGVGGSDVAAILGLSPYKTPAEVYARIVHGTPEAKGVRLRLGQIAEPHILQDYCDRHDLSMMDLQRNVEIVHPVKPYMRGELDALKTGKAFGVECKLVGQRQAERWGADGSDDIPDEYLVQVAWYSMLADIGYMAIAAWFDGGGDYREFRYERNLELEGRLRELVEKFWTDHVEKKVPPSLLGAHADTVRLIYPRGNGTVREAVGEEIFAISAYAGAHKEHAEAAAKLESIKAGLQGRIADADGLVSPQGRVTWKKSKDGTQTDYEAACKEAGVKPEIIAKHTTVKPGSRRFLWHPTKGDE